MIFDTHMHVGDFGPMFNVSLDRDGLARLMRSTATKGAASSTRTTSYVRTVVESIPERIRARVGQSAGARLRRGGRALPRPPEVPGRQAPSAARWLPCRTIRRCTRSSSCSSSAAAAGAHPLRPSHLHAAVEHRGAGRRFPGAKVILGHMGHGNVVYINAAIDIAARNPNVYLETSGMPMHTKIREAVERVGPERVLYGSDAPFHHPTVEISEGARERPRRRRPRPRPRRERPRALLRLERAANDEEGRRTSGGRIVHAERDTETRRNHAGRLTQCLASRVTLLAAVTALVVVAGGASSASKVTKVAYVSPEQATDYGWNQQGCRSARRRRPPLSAPTCSTPTARATRTSSRSSSVLPSRARA